MSTKYTRLIAAVDGSEHSARAASIAASLAKDMGKPLTLLYVLPLPGPEDVVSLDTVKGAMVDPTTLTPEVMEKVKQEAGAKVFAVARAAIQEEGVEIDEIVATGPVVPEILRVAEEQKPALLVVGRRGVGVLQEFLLGSVSNKLVHQRSLPVLVV